MEAVAGSLLSALVGMVVERLATHAKEKLVSMWGMQPALEKLQMTLLKVKDMLADAERREILAERREIQGESFLKEWLAKLRDVAYDVDDVLDEMYLKRLKDEAEGHVQVSKINSPFRRIKYSRKMQKLQSRVDGILDLAGTYELKKLAKHANQPQSAGTEGRETSSISDGQVIGRDDVKARVVELLRSAPQDECSVVSIIGMGGVGKTTLAQLVFNDEDIRNHFDLKIWLCVSHDFGKRRLTVEVIKSISSESRGTAGRSEPCVTDSWDMLQTRLKDELTGKRFLLVLDDVWNEENGKWDSLKKPFRFGEKGSKILVTTRSEKVAGIMSTTEPVLLEGLSDEHFWPLFEKIAFAGSDSGRHQNLEEIGRQIAEKLKGSPLAAKTVGRLLSSDFSIRRWRGILESEIWQLPQENSDIMPALRLSYEHLPEYVKPCFAFCSLFPKDFVFDRKELVKMWIAHDYIQPKENKLLEDTGSEYVDGLLSRSMFQYPPSRTSSNDLFVMHDLIHDLAQMISKDEYHCVKDDDDLREIRRTRTIRHLSIFYGSVELSNVKELQNLTNMRTLLFFGNGKMTQSLNTSGRRIAPVGLFRWPSNRPSAFEEIYLKAKQLRLLDISGFVVDDLDIKHLKHLRYLNFESQFGRLPESIFSLYNLQVVRFEPAFQEYFERTEISKLLNLRHMGIGKLRIMVHVGIGKLRMLQELNCKVSDKIDGNIKELGGMKQLRELKIEGLENVASKEDAIGASLTSKHYLDELELVWRTRRRNNDEEILDGLQPPRRTRVLKIVNYDGVSSPSWMKVLSVSYIEHLSLHGCEKWEDLPPLGGLRHLKSLEIDGLHGVKHVGPDFFGEEGEVNGFPSLEVLSFVDMSTWETWERVRNEANLFPHLRTLEIKRCPNLREIPFQIPPALSEFTLIDCPMLLPPGFIFLPRTLTRLTLESCGDFGHALRSTHLENLNLLKDLSIYNCPNLVGRLPPTDAALKGLATLSVQDCSGLTLGSGFEGLTCLSSLSIVNCPNMLGSLPPTDAALKGLATLSVQDCSGLTLGSGFEGLTCLSYLSIVNCPNMLGSLVEDRLVLLPSSLKYLLITGGCSHTEYDINAALSTCMRNLTSLRELKISKIELSQFRCLEKLTSLQQLWISNCPAVTTIEWDVWLPLSYLRYVNFSHCEELKSVEFPAQSVVYASPRWLSIDYCPKLLPVRFLTVRWGTAMVPVSAGASSSVVYSLTLRNMPLLQLKEWWLYLDTFPHLKDLCISSCSELTSFDADLEPAALHKLSNLKDLQIEECPSLLSLPENGLPSSIEKLYIKDCPVLKQRCEMHDIPDWSKVSHIPLVEIDGKRIPTDA